MFRYCEKIAEKIVFEKALRIRGLILKVKSTLTLALNLLFLYNYSNFLI